MCAGGAVEAQLDEPRMIEQRLDRRAQRAEPQTVAGASGGGSGRSSVRVRWSPAPKTTATNRSRSPAASESRPARRTSIGAPLARVRAAQARRQRRRVVGDDQVAGLQQVDAIARAHACATRPSGVDDSSCGRRPDAGPVSWRRSWRTARTGAGRTSGARSRGDQVAQLAAAAAAGLSVERSASGTASACSGVSMSPGSNDRK